MGISERSGPFLKSILFFAILMCEGNPLFGESVVTRIIPYGNIKVGQTNHVILPLTNDEKVPWTVESVTACCGNPIPKIDMMIIPPGKTAKITQTIRKNRAMPFEIVVSVQLSKPEKRAFLFRIDGIAVQSNVCSLGWSGRKMQKVNYRDDRVRLDQVDSNGETLVVHVASTDEAFKLKKEYASCKSKYFRFQDRLADEMESRGKTGNEVTICGDPIAPFPEGELRDEIIVKFRDESECHIPVAFRVVGDVYGECAAMGIGAIPETDTVSKLFTIHFKQGVKAWETIQWTIAGDFSKAVRISMRKDKASETTRCVEISVDGDKVASSQRGFLSARITLYNKNDADAKNSVKLLLYGYR